MHLIERYIFRIALGAFLTCLVGLTAVIWTTQALRELDLLTTKGQTFLMFLFVTALSLPALVTILSPLALFIAVLYTLNRLNGDSELVVMSAATMSPRRLLRPFIILAALVSVMVGAMALYVMPASFNELRGLITKVRADFVATFVREGQFISLDSGITFSFRERAGDSLLGIFIQDRRDPQRAIVYVAERGVATSDGDSSYLILETGSVHRQQAETRDSSIVLFERYAVDLSAFNSVDPNVVFKPRERSTWQLLFPDRNEPYFIAQEGRFRAELLDRLTSWLHPLALVLIAFAALGEPRTTRQGRGLAIAAAIGSVVAMQIAVYGASSAVVRHPVAAALVVGIPLATIAIALAIILRRREVERGLAALRQMLSRKRLADNPGGGAPA